MKTYVNYADYTAIKETFTEEEIRGKYGRLEIMSQREYRERKKKKEIENG